MRLKYTAPEHTYETSYVHRQNQAYETAAELTDAKTRAANVFAHNYPAAALIPELSRYRNLQGEDSGVHNSENDIDPVCISITDNPPEIVERRFPGLTWVTSSVFSHQNGHLGVGPETLATPVFVDFSDGMQIPIGPELLPSTKAFWDLMVFVNTELEQIQHS